MHNCSKKLQPNTITRRVMVGNVALGSGLPVVVQSMLTAAPSDAQANLEQIKQLEDAGCEIIRMAIPRFECMPAFAEVCKRSPLPVVADVHFSARIALGAIESGASKLRINPGNIGGIEKCKPIISAAKNAGVAIRIGVNAGSLDKKLAEDSTLSQPEKLAKSACEYVEAFENLGFNNLVVSAKAHDVNTTIQAYRILSKELPKIPLHIGITEAGTLFQGLIKSSAGLGILLESGIGDTMRISLTDDPVQEVRACWTLLSALGLRRRHPEIISCPTCGRCQVELIPIAKKIESALQNVTKPVSVAVMGCVVNGPGEAASADIGVACANGSGVIFAKGQTLQKVPEDKIIETLLSEIGKL